MTRTSRQWGGPWRGTAAALMTLLLVGCAAPATVTPTPSPVPVASPTAPLATPPPTVPAPGPVIVTLTLWVPEELNPYGDTPAGAVLAQQLAGFSETYPNAQVRVIVKKAHGRGGLLDLLRTASTAAPSILPDLVILDTTDLRVAAQAGLLQPMDGLLPEWLAADRFPFATRLGNVEGQTMGVVIAAWMEHLAYRPSIVATPPLTWTNVVSAPASFAFPAAAQADDVGDSTLIQYLAVGGRLVDEEGIPLLEEAPLAEVLGFYRDSVSAGVISPTLVLSLNGTESCGEVFQTTGAGALAVDSHCFWSEMSTEAACAPLPTRDGNVVTLARGWAASLVTTNPDQQRWATSLLEWLLAPENSGAWTRSGAYLPGTLSGLQEWAVTEEERATLERLLEGAVPSPDPAIRAAVGPPLQAALEAVLMGRRTPVDAAAEAARAVRP